MVYYWQFANIAYTFFDSVIMRFAFSVVLCIFVGVILYYIENSITNKLIKLVSIHMDKIMNGDMKD